MRAILLFVSFFFFTPYLSSQSIYLKKQTLYYTSFQGLDIVLAPDFDTKIDGNLMGSISCSITLTSLGVNNNLFTMPTFINYKGRKYYKNEYNSQLEPFFQNLTVTGVNIENTTNSFSDCNKWQMNSFAPGSKTSIFCKPIDKNKIEFEILSIQVTSMSGVRELQRKIDELESQKKEEALKNEATKTTENKTEQTKKTDSDDYWHTNSSTKSTTQSNTNPQSSKAEQEKQERERKIQELNTQMAKFEQQRQSLNNASDATLNQWSQGNYIEGSRTLAMEYARQGNAQGAYGTIAVGATLQIISFLGDNKKEKEEKERLAREQKLAEEAALRRKKELEEEEEKRKLLLESTRKEIMALFESKPFPTSLTKIETNKIYYFVYTPINDYKANTVSIKVSNVFALGKYPDGTWPLQKSILADLAKVLPPNQNLVFCGYFTDENIALLTLNDFVKSMGQVNVNVEKINYVGKNAQVSSQVSENNEKLTDFWGNPIKKETPNETKKENKDQPKLDFWGNPIKD